MPGAVQAVPSQLIAEHHDPTSGSPEAPAEPATPAEQDPDSPPAPHDVPPHHARPHDAAREDPPRGDPAGAGPQGAARRKTRPGLVAGLLRRPLAVLAVLVVALVVGILLVVLGGSNPSAPKVSSPSTTAGPQVRVADLGDYPTAAELNTAVARLDPSTLAPSSPPAGGAPATTKLASSAIQRCAAVIPDASTDRAVSKRLAVAAATVQGRPLLVYSYRAAAVGTVPAGIRVFIVDRASCAVEYAQNH